MSGWMRVVLPLVVVGGRAAVGPREPGGPAAVGDLADVVRHAAELEEREHPRWLVASAADALRPLVSAGVRVQRSWDVAEVHRLLHGGWRADLGARLGRRARAGPGRRPQARRRRPLRPHRRRPGRRGGGGRPGRRRPPRRLPATGRPRPVVGRLGAEVPRSVAAALTELAARQEQAAPRARPAGRRRRILRVRRCGALPRARARRPAGRPPGGRGAHRRLGRPTPGRREGGRADPPRARRPGPRPRPGSRGDRPAQPRPGAGPARRGRRLGAEHPQVRAGAVPPGATRSWTPSSTGARTSGSRRRTATAGSTSTSARTDGSAAAGPPATAPPAG